MDFPHWMSRLSHDAQEKLRMVTSYSELLTRRYEGKIDAKADEWLQFILQGAQQLDRIFERVMLYVRLDQETQSVSSFRISEPFQAAVAQVKQKVGRLQAQMEWKGAEPRIRGNYSAWALFWSEILDNSVRFRSPLGQDAELDEDLFFQVDACLDSKGISCSVIDHGSGIDSRFFPQARHDVFEPFQTYHDRKKFSVGPGLGLSICKKIVENHGGEISLVGSDQVGFRLNFSLPRSVLVEG